MVNHIPQVVMSSVRSICRRMPSAERGCKCKPATAMTPVLYFEEKYFWKTAGVPLARAMGAPMEVPR